MQHAWHFRAVRQVAWPSSKRMCLSVSVTPCHASRWCTARVEAAHLGRGVPDADTSSSREGVSSVGCRLLGPAGWLSAPGGGVEVREAVSTRGVLAVPGAGEDVSER